VTDPNPDQAVEPAASATGDADGAEGNRREFLKRAGGVVLGGCAVLAPGVAGTAVVLGPLRGSAGGGMMVRLAALDSLPLNGPPQLVPVEAERTDAWTRHPTTGIGLVFLQRTGEREVRAFQAACPHLGCAVEFRAATNGFFCPCHNSGFALDGAINDPKSPSLRGMDQLEVEIRDAGEVWVNFRNFVAGIAEKTPVA
jgi:menaquinol-cytochrome c reductase iron-sulfur subunit